MEQPLQSRGPDGRGLWVSPRRRTALLHRRLAILDLTDRGAQPMHLGRLSCTFNGEIYNFRQIRATLEAQGRRFVTDCDTEVLLHLYEVEGTRMLQRLRGMFAFAIWDDEKRELFCARDPYGIKPFYYSITGGVFRFASQVRSLQAGGGISRQFDLAAEAGFYLTGSVPEPFTVYANIAALPAGTFMKVDESGTNGPQEYASVAATFREAGLEAAELTLHELQSRATEALQDSAMAHLVADVPVGLFLSAGVDSSVLASLLNSVSPERLHTLTLAFSEYAGTRDDESILAAATAGLLRTEHHTATLSREDFDQMLPSFFAAMDQPSIDGLNSFCVSKAAVDRGLKVAISGVGADELFGGYPSFNFVPRASALLRNISRTPPVSSLAALAGRSIAAVGGPQRLRKLIALAEHGQTPASAYSVYRSLFLPSDLERIMGRDAARAGIERLRLPERMEDVSTRAGTNPYASVAALESTFYMRNQLLRDADWASMAHGLELRTPFVDFQLLRAIAPLMLNGKARGKRLMEGAAKSRLPAALFRRRKTGFTVPLSHWTDAIDTSSKGEGSRRWSRIVGERVFVR